MTEWVRSDVPVALNLSGGIDSSLIAVALKKFGLNKKILAYTSVFPGEVFDESSWAELAAERSEIRLKKIQLDFSDIQTQLVKLHGTRKHLSPASLN